MSEEIKNKMMFSSLTNTFYKPNYRLVTGSVKGMLYLSCLKDYARAYMSMHKKDSFVINEDYITSETSLTQKE